jgi:hypothetical protein
LERTPDGVGSRRASRTGTGGGVERLGAGGGSELPRRAGGVLTARSCGRDLGSGAGDFLAIASSDTRAFGALFGGAGGR